MNDTQGSAQKGDGSSQEPLADPSEDGPVLPTPAAPRRTPQWSSDALTHRWKNLLRLKNQFSSPFAVLIASVSGACWLYQFITGMGNLSYPLLGFAAVTLLALLVPEGAPRLFALRTFAFAVDLLFLGILSVAILPASYGARGRPSEFAITGVVWIWFAYFVFFDWRFHGTPGKRMLGLRVVGRGGNFGFFRSFFRGFLTLLLPVVAGVWSENLFAAGGSRIGFASALLLHATFQLANPVSILVLGGNRGIVDRVVNTEVRNGGSRCSRRRAKASSWAYACVLPFLGGITLAAYGYIAFGVIAPPPNSSFGIPAKPTGKDMIAVLAWDDPGGAFKANCLAPGFRDLSEEVLSVQADTLSKNPFTTENTDLIVNPIDAANLAHTDGLPLIRITTTSWVSPAAYSRIERNLASCYAASSDDGKHSTVVIQFDQIDDYGFFVMARHQFTVLGVDRKASSAYWGMSDLRPKAGTSVFISSDLGGYALLARGKIRERILDGY